MQFILEPSGEPQSHRVILSSVSCVLMNTLDPLVTIQFLLFFREPTGDVYATIPEIGLTNRIKALFEHAIQTENGTHCPLLWRLYICFMVSASTFALRCLILQLPLNILLIKSFQNGTFYNWFYAYECSGSIWIAKSLQKVVYVLNIFALIFCLVFVKVR